MKKIEIPVLSENPDRIPHYASEGASGADIRARLTEELVIPPGKTALIPTGLSFEIPEGYEIQVRPRSGMALKHSVTVLNTPGTIDADYRGELKVILINHGNEPFTISDGMRVAQLIVAPVVHAIFENREQLVETARGAGGFGHTGEH